MKINDEHYHILFNAFESIASKIEDHKQVVIKENRAKDIDKRVRWDALFALSRTSALPESFITTLYTYLNDTHIDTALRKVMRELFAK